MVIAKHLRYLRFNHVVSVNRICVVMGCLEMDVGKSHEIAFSMTVQRDFQCAFSQELITTSFLLRGTK